MSIWIIYGLVIIFLVAFPLLVLVLVQAPGTSVQSQPSSAARVDRVAYGAAAALLVLFVVLTFVIRRGKA